MTKPDTTRESRDKLEALMIQLHESTKTEILKEVKEFGIALNIHQKDDLIATQKVELAQQRIELNLAKHNEVTDEKAGRLADKITALEREAREKLERVAEETAAKIKRIQDDQAECRAAQDKKDNNRWLLRLTIIGCALTSVGAFVVVVLDKLILKK
jgi:hypothetical protein